MGLQSVLLDCIADIIYTYLKGGTNMSERELRIERRRVIREKREACQEILRCLFDSFFFLISAAIIVIGLGVFFV